jgi:hypothetical protein
VLKRVIVWSGPRSSSTWIPRRLGVTKLFP